MRSRLAIPGSLIASLLAFGGTCGEALAQRQPLLDLGAAPQAPAAGQGAGTLALAEDLHRQAASPSAGELGHAMAAVRELARALLASGEAMGQAGSQRVVMGRTLAGGLTEIDRQIAGLQGSAGEARAALAAQDMEAAASALTKNDADAWRIVRDGVALLVRDGDGQGWPDESAARDGPLEVDGWSKAPGVTPEAVAAVKALDALAEAGNARPAYRASALHLRAAIRDAARLLSGAPAWIPEPALRVVGEQFSAAVMRVSSETGRDEGMRALRRLARLASLVGRVDTLEESPAVKRVRTAVAQAVASVPSDAAAEAQELEAFDRVLDLALARRGLPEEKTLLRQVRPAWRVLGAGLKASEQKLELALVEALTRVDAMTDPGVAAVVASHRRMVQDMEALAGLNAAISEPGKGGEPAVVEAWKRVPDRVFKLGQDLAKADTKDAALTSLRAMAEEIADFTKLPGEDELREAVRAARLAAEKNEKAPASVWSVLTGGRESALLSEISDRRGGWMAGWDKAGYAGAAGDVEGLRTLRGLMRVLDEARWITPIAGEGVTPEYAALRAWPGWELSDDGFAAIAGGLSAETGEAAAAIVSGDAGKCGAFVEKIRAERAAALLAGRLARDAAARGMKAGGTALAEVGSGGPVAGVSWMGGSADRIADVCRYAEEAAVARKLGAKDRAEGILRFVNARAGE